MVLLCVIEFTSTFTCNILESLCLLMKDAQLFSFAILRVSVALFGFIMKARLRLEFRVQKLNKYSLL